MTKFIISCLSITYIVIVSQSIHAQEIEYPAKEYIASDGTIFWNKKLPIYLRISPYPEATGHLLKSTVEEHANPLYLDTEGTNYVRTKFAVNRETQETVIPKVEVLMPIVADGTGPTSSILFKTAKRSYNNNTQFYGPELSVAISTTDRLSGVEQLLYSIDGSDFSAVTQDLVLNTEGNHSISYYGVDNVGNKETTLTSNFVVDLTPPIVSHNINGFADNNVIASPSKIYFTSSDALSGVSKIYYRFDDEEFKLYNGSEVKFTYLADGDHTMEYYAEDKVGNASSIFVTELYFDKTAPITASDVLGDRFVVNNRVYFSGRTKMKLTAVDNKIGVKEIRYSINSTTDFQTYEQPFYLPTRPGQHTIRYYSVDRLANKPSGSETYKHNISLVYLDLAGPNVSSKISGPSFRAAGVQYISPRTEISLVGSDPGSGLQYMTYSIDGDAAEQRYTEPFTINTTGKHDIELFAYDNVNNRNIGSTSVFVDATPPVIFPNYSTQPIAIEDGLDVYPPYVTVFFAATDDIVGNDKIYYSINDGAERLYIKPISGLRKNSVYKIDIRAVDKVGNESTRTINFKTAAN